MKISGILVMVKNIEFSIFRIIVVIFFTLLLLTFESESTSVNQSTGYLYVTGELSLGWQNRELPIFDNPGGKLV
jgi:hypothetical protein